MTLRKRKSAIIVSGRPTTREAAPMQDIDIGCADYELALDAIAMYISIADKIRDPIL
jgi:hypothetical protein